MAFLNDIKSKHLSNFVLVTIGDIRISTQKITFDGEYYKPILLNIPSISESLDIEQRKYKISSVSLSISDYKEDGERFSDTLNTLINKEVNIYYSSPSCSDLNDCYKAGTYIVRSFSQDEDKVTLNCEDLSQDKLHRDMLVNTVPDDDNILDKYKGKSIPMVFGEVDKSPCVAFMGNNPSNSALKIYCDIEDSLSRYNESPLSDLELLNNTSNPLFIFKDDTYFNVLSNFSNMSHWDDGWENEQYEVYTESPIIEVNVDISGGVTNNELSPLSIDSVAVRTNDKPVKINLKKNQEVGLYGYSSDYNLQVIVALYNATELGELVAISFNTVESDDGVTLYHLYSYTEQHQYAQLPNIHPDYKDVYNQAQYNYLWTLDGFSGSNNRDYRLWINNQIVDSFENISTGDSEQSSNVNDVLDMGWTSEDDTYKFNEYKVTASPDSLYAYANNKLEIDGITRNCIYLFNEFHKSNFYASVIGRQGSAPSSQSIYSEILSELDFDEELIQPSLGDIELGKYAFTIDKKINSKKLIEELSQSTPLYPYFKDGEFRVKSIKKAYSYGDSIPIDVNDVIKYKYDRTKIEKVYTRVNVKYHYDYGLKDFTKETGFVTPIQSGLSDGYLTGDNEDYFGQDFDQEFVFESKYIRDKTTAFNLAKYLCGLHANQHNIVTLTLPLNYLTLELGDIVRLDDLIQGRKIFGEDYSSVSISDNSYVRNGQNVYKFWFVEQIKKSLDKVEVKLYQLHEFNFVAGVVDIIDEPEEPEIPTLPNVEYCPLPDYEETLLDADGNPVDWNTEVNWVANPALCINPIEEEVVETLGYCLIGGSAEYGSTESECTQQGGEWSATPIVLGCTDNSALNTNPYATNEDNSQCVFQTELQPPTITSPVEDEVIPIEPYIGDTHFQEAIQDSDWLVDGVSNYTLEGGNESIIIKSFSSITPQLRIYTEESIQTGLYTYRLVARRLTNWSVGLKVGVGFVSDSSTISIGENYGTFSGNFSVSSSSADDGYFVIKQSGGNANATDNSWEIDTIEIKKNDQNVLPDPDRNSYFLNNIAEEETEELIIPSPILNVTWNKSPNLIEPIPQLPDLNLIGDYIVSLVRTFINENGEVEAENVYTNALSPINAVLGQETYSHSIDMESEEITPNSQLQVNVIARSFSNYNGTDIFTGLGGLQDEQFITFPIAPSAVNVIYGEIEEEEQLTVVNVVQLVGFILGFTTPTEQQIQDNDYNNDGILNIVDVLLLVNIILDVDED